MYPWLTDGRSENTLVWTDNVSAWIDRQRSDLYIPPAAPHQSLPRLGGMYLHSHPVSGDLSQSLFSVRQGYGPTSRSSSL